MIYVASILDKKFVKVGFTADEDIRPRIAQLQTGCPYEIELACSVEGTLRQEQTLHSVLRDAFARMRLPMPPNEWYPGRHSFMSEFIDALRYGVDLAVACAVKQHASVKQPSPRFDEDLRPILRWPQPSRR